MAYVLWIRFSTNTCCGWQVKMSTVTMSKSQCRKLTMSKVNMWKVTMSTSGKCRKSTSQNVAWSHTHRTWQMTKMGTKIIPLRGIQGAQCH